MIIRNTMMALLLVFFTIMILSCSLGEQPGFTIVGNTRVDVSTDITIKCLTKPFKDSWTVGFTDNAFFGGDAAGISAVGYNVMGARCWFSAIKERVDEYTIKVTVPYGTTTGYVAIGNLAGVDECFDILFINYPETLSFSSNSVNVGEQITITSTQAFFDTATFSQSKLDSLLERKYYIVWVESDEYEHEDSTCGLAYENETRRLVNANLEKRPVTKEYYVDVTTDSITFVVPPYAKTGRVHIINEAGFCVDLVANADGDATQDLYNPLVTKPDAPAYFSSSVDLIVK